MNHHNSGNLPSFAKNGIYTRSKSNLLSNITNKQPAKKSTALMAKRKADESPLKGKYVKAMRAAFGDLTNNTVSKSTASSDAKKVTAFHPKGNKTNINLKGQEKQTTKIVVKPKDVPVTAKAKPPVIGKELTLKPAKSLPLLGVQTRRSLKTKDVPIKSDENAKQVKRSTKKNVYETSVVNVAPRKTFTNFGKTSVASTAITKPHGATLVKYTTTSDASEAAATAPSKQHEVVVLSSSSSSSSSLSASSPDSSLYVSAQEELIADESKVEASEKVEEKNTVSESAKSSEPCELAVPPGVDDFDQETIGDPFQVAVYAMDIFNYLREREAKFAIYDYMPNQVCLTKDMRALLVDWMVEIQETFELNHETLYLAVKLVDLYLSKVMVTKEMMQLIGAASIFIASKFDERTPPLIDDFLYICDGAYSHDEMIKAEMNVVKVVDYDLGIPLSYRFLRRYARCAKVSMPILTLARYILEFSLMDYSFIFYSDSKLAASALFLALQMKNLGGWTKTLEYYTSHTLDEIKDIIIPLNNLLHKKHPDNLKTVKNKYSHRIFFEVAKIPLLKEVDL